MRIRAFHALGLALFFTSGMAQPMVLTGGSMHVYEGTSLRLEGPLVLTVGQGASVVNDGLIDLGTEGLLNEAPGNPVTGLGTEYATTTNGAPFSAIEPGGLGLTISTTDAFGVVVVTRGHTPLTFPEGDQSIARWFSIVSAPAPDASMTVSFAYDATELNDLEASDLSLFNAPVALGPWSGLASTNGPAEFTLEANLQFPWGIITAFDRNAPTASPTLVAAHGFHVWPTLVEDLINVVPSASQERIATLEVFDGLGRSTPLKSLLSSPMHGQLHLGSLPPGAYFLRVNGLYTFKFRKV